MRTRPRYRFEHLDAAENAFLSRALEQVAARTYDIRYPQLRAREFIPVNNSLDPATETYRWQEFSQAGMAKIIKDYGDDLPRSDVVSKEYTTTFKSIGNSYGYSIQEVRAAQRTGTALSDKKAAAARRANDVLADRILTTGDTATGLVGLFAVANAQAYTVPNGVSGTATWATKTGEEILADMIGVVDILPKNTNNFEQANTLLLPRNQFVIAATKPWRTTGETTVMQAFKTMYPAVRVDSWVVLATAGSGGTARMIAYDASPDVLEAMIPQEFEQFPAQPKNLKFLVPCHSRIGGVVCYRPMAIANGDGI